MAPWYTSVQEFDKAEPSCASGERGASPPPTEPKAPKRHRRRPNKLLPEPGTGPTGGGWIISLRGYHFHNDKVHLETSQERYVRQTFIKNLKAGKITIPEQDRGEGGPPKSI